MKILLRFALWIAALAFIGQAQAAPLPNGGSSVTGDITASSPQQTWTFDGLTGQSVWLRMANLSGGLDPQIQIYHEPTGDFIASNSDTTVAHVDGIRLPLNGPYQVVVSDWSGNGDDIGSYRLHYAKAPDAEEHGSLIDGGSVTEEIEIGDVDTYTFEGLTGERIFLRMADLNGSDQNLPGNFDPLIFLYAPNGDFIASNSDSVVGHIDSVRLPLNGTYTVVVTDWAGNGSDDVGAYELHFAKAPGASEHGGLVSGGSVTQTIGLGDVDSFSFDGRTDERVWLRMADLNGSDPNLPGNFDPEIYLYAPDGDFVASNSDSIVGHIDSVRLPLNGTYTVVVTDWAGNGSDDVGAYELHFAKAPGASEHGGLVSGGSVTQTIGLGDIDSYAFYGETGNAVTLTMTDLNGPDPNLPGNFDPSLYLYSPTGALVAFDTDSSQASLGNVTLPLNGTYTVIVADWAGNGSDDTGPYSLAFTTTGSNTPPPPSEPLAPVGADNPVRPALSWAPVGFASWYRIWVQDATGNVLLRQWYSDRDATCVAASAHCTTVLPISVTGNAVYWVLSWNVFGAGVWSSPVEFSTVAGPPPTPAPLNPIGSAPSSTPEYSWQRVPNASWYRVWVDDESGGRIRDWITAGQAGCAAPGETCAYRFPTSVRGDTNWWVRAWNSDGAGPWSSRVAFRP